ncbi:DeoR family transcriptional regulator [Streptomyces sp. NPDC101206]|uniref:DeoR family transcriptional regulator n=1 Tax=Streptomyces sp. NPDC101206 TaxID=3366128 RepID=UPI0038077A43
MRQGAPTGASTRQIAAQLGVSKNTVRRDLTRQVGPTEAPAQRQARRVAQAETAVRQACAAAQVVAAASQAYVLVDDATAARWGAELRAAAELLLAQADAFADYYPRAPGLRTGSALRCTKAPETTGTTSWGPRAARSEGRGHRWVSDRGCQMRRGSMMTSGEEERTTLAAGDDAASHADARRDG